MTDDDYSEFVGKLTTQLLASGQKLGNIIRVSPKGEFNHINQHVQDVPPVKITKEMLENGNYIYILNFCLINKEKSQSASLKLP